MRGYWFVNLAIVMTLLTAEASAQQPPPREPGDRPATGIQRDALLSKTVVGARVKNREGKDLGEIDDLVIDAKTGQVSHVVLGLGGLAGVGESKVVVAWKDIQMIADPHLPFRTIASVEQAIIERAPRWDRGDDRGARDRSPAASPSTIPPVPRSAPRY